MTEKPKQNQLNSLYIPLILAIPANIILLVQMLASEETGRGIILYAVFTFFLFATGYMAIRREDKKAKTFGSTYLAAGVIFVLLFFFIL